MKVSHFGGLHFGLWVSVLFGALCPLQTKAATTAPTNLRATDYCNSVAISWASSGGSQLQGFKIYRDGTLLATTSASATSYTDWSFSTVSACTYYVAAYDNKGEYPSTTVSVVPCPDTTPPATPASLSASLQDYSVSLSWAAATDTPGQKLEWVS